MHDNDDIQKIELHATLKIIIDSPAQEGFEQLVLKKLTEIATQVGIVIQKENKMDQKIENMRVAFDDATTAIANRIQAILDKIGTGVNPDEVVSLMAPELERLKGLGSDPTNPVPEVPPPA